MGIMTSAAPRFGLLAVIILLLGTSSFLSAQTFDQVGERAQGMGGAFVAVADDASAIYWNPAGLANIYAFDAQMSLSHLGHLAGTAGVTDSTHASLLGVAVPAIGVGYYRVRTAVSSSGSRNEGSV